MTASQLLQALSPVLQTKALRRTSIDASNLDEPLGAGGLGLDSIAIAEMLLEIEERTGLDAMSLLANGSTLTLRSIAEKLVAADSRS